MQSLRDSIVLLETLPSTDVAGLVSAAATRFVAVEKSSLNGWENRIGIITPRKDHSAPKGAL